jgi:LacI family transcriptional regulator
VQKNPLKVRVTQGDVARVAGVHHTTVSLSLRNSPLIPEPTRERIQSIAQSLGYRSDPTLRALVAYRNSRRARRHVEPLAYVTHWTSRWGWRELGAHERCHGGVQRRAAELGYQLEHLWLGEEGMDSRRLDRMLLHRGIGGVLLAAHESEWSELAAVDWSRISVVRIGTFPPAPGFNQVAIDSTDIVRLALGRLRLRGYRRVGFVLPRREDQLADDRWSAAFQAEQFRRAATDPIPVLRLAGHPIPAASTGAALADWYRRYQPEAIIGLTHEVLFEVRRCGLRVPQDVAYADLSVDETDDAIAGVWQNCERLGELAVEMLSNQVEQNARGLPAVPVTTSIGGKWRDGASLPETPVGAKPVSSGNVAS